MDGWTEPDERESVVQIVLFFELKLLITNLCLINSTAFTLFVGDLVAFTSGSSSTATTWDDLHLVSSDVLYCTSFQSCLRYISTHVTCQMRPILTRWHASIS
jgi:hypothetical protein